MRMANETVNNQHEVVVDEPLHLFGEDDTSSRDCTRFRRCLAVGITAVATWKEETFQIRIIFR